MPELLRLKISFVPQLLSNVNILKILISNISLKKIYALAVPNVSRAVLHLVMVRCTFRFGMTAAKTAMIAP